MDVYIKFSREGLGMKKKGVIFLVLVFITCMFIGISLVSISDDYRMRAKVSSADSNLLSHLIQLIYLDEEHSKFVLREGLPIVRAENNRQEFLSNSDSPRFVASAFMFMTDLPLSFFQFDSYGDVEQVVQEVTGEELGRQVREKMKAEGTHEDEERRRVELDFWQTEPSPSDREDGKGERREEDDSRLQPDLKSPGEIEDDFGTQDALVGIYHSHTSENYENRGYQGNAFAGERGDIVEIGQLFKQELEQKYGIPTAHSKKVHDENYSRSYLASLETSKQMVEQNENLQMLFDVHRDALGAVDKSRITTTIDEKNTARILIIVTSDDYLPNPYWRENLEFAKDLARRMEQMYPGLLRDVEIINNRRYNQHVNPGTLLIEVGGVRNTIPEAKRSVRLFAEVVASLMQEEI